MSADFETSVTLRSRVRVVGDGTRGGPLVVALHGWGMTARSLERWLRPGIESGGTTWWIPRGVLPLEVRSRKIGYAWYVFDGDQDALRASMDEARHYLVALVENARRALAPRRVTLFGFSQGAYLGSYVALRHPELFDRLICCCGRPKTEFVEDPARASALEVLVQTGARDDAVKPELIQKGVDPLLAAGVSVEVRQYDAEHRVVPEMARDAAEFAS